MTLQIRIGIGTGLVVVGSIGDDLRMGYTAVADIVAYEMNRQDGLSNLLVQVF